jgi:hypothetical protein
MTEDKWLESDDPVALLDFARRKVSPRKVRLFACACCRLVWDRLTDERSRQAVRTAERFADGEVSAKVLERHEDAAWQLVSRVMERTPRQYANLVAWQSAFQITEADPTHFIRRVVRASDDRVSPAALAVLLREVCGNPFRPVRIEPAWLRWHQGCVENLARVIYREGRFDEVPVLGDALEEAGCSDEEILLHCQDCDGSDHVRGCWVVDAILAKT